ncbi:MAG: flavin-containing monooxygenase [Candidatus Velthaea sp.]
MSLVPRQTDAEIIIVGAGFAGLGMAIRLKRAGLHSFLVLERAADVGGTWRDNVYPGCACDIPTALYSFSFERNAAWTRVFPRQGELLEYLRRCAARYGILAHIRFRTQLAGARFDAQRGIWTVRSSDGRAFESRILIAAMGPLSKPNVPYIGGAERFAGAAFHSAQWDRSVNLRGKRVAVIGTGASAVQIVPEIAPLAERLTVYQRTPPWIIPRGDRAVTPAQRLRLRLFPGYAWLRRKLLYWMLEFRALGFTVMPSLLKTQERAALRFLEKEIAEPQLRAMLVPGYRMGCKRVLLSDDYYATLRRANVEVVTEPIAAIEEAAIRTADGAERAADVIVYATGFRATEGVAPVRIEGAAGRELGEEWRDGMQAYLGTSVAGFPNLFLLVGPNTGLGHNSMVLMMEAQYRYVLDALRFMRRGKVRALDVRRSEQAAFNARLQARMRRTVWSSGCSSWYIDAGGKNTTLWPGFTFSYRWLTRRFVPARYALTPE